MANGMTSDVISTLGAECGDEMSFPFAKEDVFAFEIGIVGEASSIVRLAPICPTTIPTRVKGGESVSMR